MAALLVAAGVTACGTEATPDTGPSGKGPGATQQPGPTPQHAAHAAHQPRERPFTLVGTGDLLIHDSLIRQARADAGGTGHSFRRMLADAERTADSADLALCHMETVYGEKEGPFTGYPEFKTPPRLAADVKAAGYDGCSTASNHTLDAGTDGIARTLGAMDEAGLRHAGSARSAKEARTPAWLRAGGATVAHLAYTYGTNGIPKPKPWSVNLIDTRRILADAKAARKAGADVVVVSPHWGTEFQQAPDRLQRRVARELTASPDIDLILGTHAHVPQAYEKRNGTWVVYGMGDQVAGVMDDPRGSMGSAPRFTFRPPAEPGGRWRVARAEFIPTYADPERGYRATNLPRAEKAGPLTAKQAGARRTVREAVLSLGAAKDGLREGR
ncbi:CapA family protein [Streptomyces sp. ODS28]|uniref:CapA family protein n=1 Tax=Streptomyces sp. ODS28 TaxID=3136688 RepID=UPI0031F1C2DB